MLAMVGKPRALEKQDEATMGSHSSGVIQFNTECVARTRAARGMDEHGIQRHMTTAKMSKRTASALLSGVDRKVISQNRWKT